ncbi:MAG TPA: hypothetical protein VFV68_15635 [Agriterribacter sp.]|nr:hypothetical protein [Agriterribacter sp.]
MYKLFPALLFVMLSFTNLSAQQQESDVTGSYFLEGVRETASGFQLKNNNTFTFFFTYGGLDRYGSGIWEMNKNTLVFNSRSKFHKDFQVLSAKRVNDNFVTIKFSNDNPGLNRDIECILYTARGRQKLYSNEEGIVKFPKNVVDSIQIFSALFPDHPFTFIVTNKIENSFEFAFDKSIAEVFFENFTLLLTNNMLVGKHPLLNGNQFRYVKDK